MGELDQAALEKAWEAAIAHKPNARAGLVLTGEGMEAAIRAYLDATAPSRAPDGGVTLNLDALEGVARAATKGTWRLFRGEKIFSVFKGPACRGKNEIVHWMGFDQLSTSWPQRGRDAAHIATFDPPTVLRLIELARLAASHAGDRERLLGEALNCADHLISNYERLQRAEPVRDMAEATGCYRQVRDRALAPAAGQDDAGEGQL